MKALIAETKAGFSILVEGRKIGNFATKRDAMRVCILNGYEVKRTSSINQQIGRALRRASLTTKGAQ